MTSSLVKAVAKPYAKGFFDSVKSEGFSALVEAKKELYNISNVLLTIPYLKSYLMDPTISRFSKKALIETAFTERLSQKTLTLLFILLERNRMEVFEEVVWWFGELYEADRGYINVTFTSALPLPTGVQLAIGDSIKEKVGVKGVNCEFRVDQTKLIGGFILEVGDSQIYDASICGRFKAIRSFLKM